MHRITDQRFVGTKESEGFVLPNGTFGTMTGNTLEEVLKRIEVLRDFYSRCELTEETQVVLMPNGQEITGVPVGLTGQDIFKVANAALSIRDRLYDFSPCQQLQSGMVH